MTEYEKQSLHTLNEIHRMLAYIQSDLKWFKQREISKADAIDRMVDNVRAAVPSMPKP